MKLSATKTEIYLELYFTDVINYLNMYLFIAFFWGGYVFFVKILFKCVFYIFIGKRCEAVFNGCKDTPCKNGGTCAVASNTKHGYICKCQPVRKSAHIYS